MILPDEINDDLIEILGFVCFRAVRIAHAMRAAGQTIKPKAEHEQAHVIHKLLQLYAEHGPEWRPAAADWIDSLQTQEAEPKALQP